MKTKQIKSLIYFLLLAVAFIYYQLNPEKPTESLATNVVQGSEHVKVVRIVDGDTVVVGDNRKIRMIGIDAPEIAHPNDTAGNLPAAECYGEVASKKLEEMLQLGLVDLETEEGVPEKDRYGRELAYLYLGNDNLNFRMVELGMAKVYEPQAFSQKEAFLIAQEKAKSNKIGLWDTSNCPK